MLRGEMTSAQSPKAVAYSLWGSSSTMWAAGCFSRMERRIEGRGARFAGAGRAENGEVLAEQVVDADHGRDRGVLADAADAHRAVGVAAKRDGQFVLGGDAHAVSERGIDR